jgi:HTH-type transcriptional regulator, transcriptional repressor of NAD biosynthesis genes
VDFSTYLGLSEPFPEIVRRRQEIEDKLARKANRMLVSDTAVLATAVWHQRYLPTRSGPLDSLVASSRHDLYLLTDVDLPFRTACATARPSGKR